MAPLICPTLTGLGPQDPSARPLAGSAVLTWASARDARTGAALTLDAATTDALTRPRAALCGLSLAKPLIMGILNVTPDSFSDGGKHAGLEAALTRARQMALEADIIDIGGESTRPGAADVSARDEAARIAPVIRAIRAEGIKTLISIDTRKAHVAAAALEAGADIINDVTALRYDADMAAVARDSGAPICLMHSVADPATMQAHARYRDVVAEVHAHLGERIEAALAAGISEEKIILDPGIGFGKTTEHDLDLMRHLACFHSFGLPVLLGASRKKFIGALTQTPTPADRVAGSVQIALEGAAQGVQILRVHDTKETAQALAMWWALRDGKTASGI